MTTTFCMYCYERVGVSGGGGFLVDSAQDLISKGIFRRGREVFVKDVDGNLPL
jgi:hypothetical protein